MAWVFPTYLAVRCWVPGFVWLKGSSGVGGAESLGVLRYAQDDGKCNSEDKSNGKDKRRFPSGMTNKNKQQQKQQHRQPQILRLAALAQDDTVKFGAPVVELR